MTQLEYDAYLARTLARAQGVFAGLPPDPGPEGDLHSKILEECRRRGWLAFHGSMAKRTHRKPGEMDFTCLLPEGRVLLVECKGPSGKLSVAQQCVIAHARKLGHRVDVIRSFREFVRLADQKL